MQRTANENAACLRRICKRSEQSKIERTASNDARLILRRSLRGQRHGTRHFIGRDVYNTRPEVFFSETRILRMLMLDCHCVSNPDPRAHVPFGQYQDTELWNNQFPETKILGLPVSRRMRGLVCMASRDKVDVDTFHKGIQYALEKLGKSKFGFERTAVSNFKSKRHEGSGNELVDYFRAPCLGADQKARGLWERDWTLTRAYNAVLGPGFPRLRRSRNHRVLVS